MSTITMTELLKKQEEDRQNLAGGAYIAWKGVRENEQSLLASFNNQYEKAPEHVRQTIDQGKEQFFSEWGSKGRLTALMEQQHEKEREKLVTQMKILEDLDKKRSNDQGNGR